MARSSFRCQPKTNSTTSRTTAVTTAKAVPLCRSVPRHPADSRNPTDGEAISEGWQPRFIGARDHREARLPGRRGGQLHHVFAKDTSIGPLRDQLDWSFLRRLGDGETTGPHSVEGGPWPDGQITHAYIHVGHYDVVVTEE